MHDLIVVLSSVVLFVVVLRVYRAIFDSLDRHHTKRTIESLNNHIEENNHSFDRGCVAVITTELYSRLSMTGEYKLLPHHVTVVDSIAKYIFILACCQLRNQLDMLTVVSDQINKHSDHTARINITTNNRLELIVQHKSSEKLIYIKFHSINTLF